MLFHSLPVIIFNSQTLSQPLFLSSSTKPFLKKTKQNKITLKYHMICVDLHPFVPFWDLYASLCGCHLLFYGPKNIYSVRMYGPVSVCSDPSKEANNLTTHHHLAVLTASSITYWRVCVTPGCPIVLS